MINKVTIFKGSNRDFKLFLQSREINEDSDLIQFMELIQLYNSKIRTKDSSTIEVFENDFIEYDYCIVNSEDYASVLEHVIMNFKNIVTLNTHIDEIILHNPPKRVEKSMSSEIDNVNYHFSEYKPVEKTHLKEIYDSLSGKVLNQENAILDVISLLYKETSGIVDKPIVIHLYGPSGVGKTETAKVLSDFYGGKLLQIQFSMMQTQESLKYVFGG